MVWYLIRSNIESINVQRHNILIINNLYYNNIINIIFDNILLIISVIKCDKVIRLYMLLLQVYISCLFLLISEILLYGSNILIQTSDEKNH